MKKREYLRYLHIRLQICILLFSSFDKSLSNTEAKKVKAKGCDIMRANSSIIVLLFKDDGEKLRIENVDTKNWKLLLEKA